MWFFNFIKFIDFNFGIYLLPIKIFFKKKLFKFSQYKSETKTEKLNPDINTLDWDLHKIRLKRFGRSQYKGLTFFINDKGTIYYLNENGIKVYC